MNYLLIGKIALNFITLTCCFGAIRNVAYVTCNYHYAEDHALRDNVIRCVIAAALLTALAYYPAT